MDLQKFVFEQPLAYNDLPGNVIESSDTNKFLQNQIALYLYGRIGGRGDTPIGSIDSHSSKHSNSTFAHS